MKKIISLLGVCFLFVSCKQISGSFTVNKSFSAKVDNHCGWDPFNNCTPVKSVTIEPGNYNSKIDFASKDVIRIEVKANKFNETIILTRPNNFEFPENGSFNLSASEINQEFDIQGQTRTLVTTSERRQGRESCTYTVNEYVCYPGNDGHTVCSYQPRQVLGYRFVEFYLETTTRNLSASLISSSSDVAHFDGDRSDTRKIYLYKGICR